MYKWYANAQVCYAYLSDVVVNRNLESALRLSEWFTRGWTLQELLAPRVVEFYDRNWLEIGTKQSMSWLLADITGIGRGPLSGDDDKICIAQKLSWAARRKTTRAEDLAYCLMGLFDVNMPLLYGEGAEKAFVRLQTEVMAKTTDESIFAWSNPETDRMLLPLLAEHPSWFASSGHIYLPKRQMLLERSSTHQMTSRGVRIEALRIPTKRLEKIPHPGVEEDFLMPLNSYERWKSDDGDHYHVLAIPMTKLRGSTSRSLLDVWYRLPVLELIEVNEKAIQSFREKDKEIIYVPQTELLEPLPWRFRARTLIRTHSLDKYGFNLIDENTWSLFSGQGHVQYLGRNAQGDLVLQYFGRERNPKVECGFLFGNKRMKFALLISLYLQCSCDLQSGVPQDKQVLGYMKKPDKPFWTSQGGNQDRCSYCLKDNLYVSASVRLGREWGKLVNIVDVTISTQDRWLKGIRAPV
jgi:hypothetical protein